MIDTAEETLHKNYLFSLQAESLLFLRSLNLDAKVVFDLNKMIHSRNVQAHKFDNRKFKDAAYVHERLTDFSDLVSELTVANVLRPHKDYIVRLVTSMVMLHPLVLQKGGYA